jgi:hypothetical protein
VSLLARKAPELEKLLPVVIEVFTEFLTERFRGDLKQFAADVVLASGAATAGDSGIPRIPARLFQRFREVFEKSFLERMVMGVQEPLTSLGTLISQGAQDMEAAPWLLIFPSVTMVATLMCFNFIGDGLRDAIDPKDR